MGARRGPVVVALVALAAYGVWTAWALGTASPAELARPGSVFVEREGGSDAIEELRDDTASDFGYDGQFFLFWALDPTDASPYIDGASYRLTRILYPAVSRALALGQPELVPSAMLLVNLLAVALGTFALAYVMSRRGVSPWWALLFGGFPGMFLAVSHGLSEPLAYALVAAGVALLERDGLERPWRAAVVFGLAGITRETTLVFPLVLALCGAAGVSERAGERARPVRWAAFLAVAVVPYVALKLLLFAIYESWGVPHDAGTSLVPFASFVAAWPDDEGQVSLELLCIALPALVALALAALSLRRLTPSLALLAANAALVVAVLPKVAVEDYIAVGRLASGVVVAFLLVLPAIRHARWSRLAWVPVVLLLAPWPAVGALAKPL